MNFTLRRGLAITEVIVLILIAVVLCAGAMPMLQSVRCGDGLETSKDNLATLAMAHAAYAADWNDRQFTVVRDDLGAFTGSCVLYNEVSCHPPLLFGEDCMGVDRGFSFGCDGASGDCLTGFGYVKPFHFDPGPFAAIGSYLIPNAAGFQPYVNGRFFDPTFYAPRDLVALDIVEPLFEVDCAYAADVVDPSLFLSSSYSVSPAAMVDPGVLTAIGEPNPAGSTGFASPYSYDEGYRSPAFNQALYPSLKTHMLEQRWLQREPVFRCDPNIDDGTFEGCEPYWFHGSWDSRPVTLFYDGHVRTLSVREAELADSREPFLENHLWHRGVPFLSGSYSNDRRFDFRANTMFHLLTIDGIRGRDTLD